MWWIDKGERSRGLSRGDFGGTVGAFALAGKGRADGLDGWRACDEVIGEGSELRRWSMTGVVDDEVGCRIRLTLSMLVCAGASEQPQQHHRARSSAPRASSSTVSSKLAQRVMTRH